MPQQLKLPLSCGSTKTGAIIRLTAVQDDNVLSNMTTELAAHDPWQRLGISSDQLKQSFLHASPRNVPCLILCDQSCVGGIILEQPWLFGVYIKSFGLMPSFQKKGIGATVLLHLKAALKATGVRNLWVCASAFNTEAVSFYEDNGFEVCCRLEGLVVADEDEIFLRCRL